MIQDLSSIERVVKAKKWEAKFEARNPE